MLIPLPTEAAEPFRVLPRLLPFDDVELFPFCFRVSLRRSARLGTTFIPQHFFSNGWGMHGTYPMFSSHGSCLFLEGKFFGIDGNSGLTTTWTSSSLSISTSARGLDLELLASTDVEDMVVLSLEEEAVADVVAVGGVGGVLGLSAAIMAFRRASFAASGSLVILRFTLISQLNAYDKSRTAELTFRD